jgi:hypothetical protein
MASQGAGKVVFRDRAELELCRGEVVAPAAYSVELQLAGACCAVLHNAAVMTWMLLGLCKGVEVQLNRCLQRTAWDAACRCVACGWVQKRC